MSDEEEEMNTDKRPIILCVEDNKMIQHILKTNLVNLNCTVDIASTGKQAIELYSKREYDLVLTDIGLPDMSGIDVTRKIRELENNKSTQIPVVAITAHMGSDYESRKACLDVGIQAVYTKPILNEQINTILKTFVCQK